MPLKLYNTFSKREEEFVPLETGKVRMYTCGPTVYGRPHVGNYSSFLMADLLRRWLQAGHTLTVSHVKNITDVGHLLHDADHGDDKIQSQAEKEKIHPLEVAKRYTEEYLADEKELRMLEPLARPRASAFIPQMLAIVRTLLEKGNAYETEDGVYFSVESFPRYGMLSGNLLQNMSAGARVEVDEKKKHPADFALWKKCVGDNARHVLRWSFATGAVSTSSGPDPSSGFPGWHIECSAMSSSLLGAQIDIHTGGEDNIFPHHECEIAQSECAGPAPFARFWLHKRRIDMGAAKMSKSLGNVLTLPDVAAKGYSALDLRYHLLSVHYRTNLKFSWGGVDDAHKARRKIIEWMENVEHRPTADGRPSKAEWFHHARGDFADSMDADLNTPAALAAIFTVMTFCNSHFPLHPAERAELLTFIHLVRETFGCFEAAEEGIPAQVRSLLDQRRAARDAKDFARSDALRAAIHDLGYEVRDTGSEQVVKKL